MRNAKDCESMVELRIEIDAIDDKIIKLLACRAAFIDRAVTLKQREGLPARTTARVAAVLDRVAQEARQQGLDPDFARKLWTAIIDWSIAIEAKELGEK